MPLVRALPKDLAQGRTRGPAQNLGNLSGGAEPRLTSGGEAGVDGVKFSGSAFIFKTVSHIRRQSRNEARLNDFSCKPSSLLKHLPEGLAFVDGGIGNSLEAHVATHFFKRIPFVRDHPCFHFSAQSL